MRTLDDILETEAAEMQPACEAIGKMIADTSGEIEWPELEEEPEHGICRNCDGTGCYQCRNTGEI